MKKQLLLVMLCVGMFCGTEAKRAGSGAAIRIRPGRTLHEGEAEHDAFLHICRSALVPEGQ